MPKKKGAKTQETAQQSAVQEQTTDLDDQKTENTKVDDVKQQMQMMQAVSTEKQQQFSAEEQKVDPELIPAAEEAEQAEQQLAQTAGFARKNSRFDLSKAETGDEANDKSGPLYRPEFGQPPANGQQKMWELMGSYIGSDERSIQRSIVNHVEYTLARTRFNFDNMGAYQATAYSVRDRLIEAWNDTQQFHTVSKIFWRSFFLRFSL